MGILYDTATTYVMTDAIAKRILADIDAAEEKGGDQNSTGLQPHYDNNGNCVSCSHGA